MRAGRAHLYGYVRVPFTADSSVNSTSHRQAKDLEDVVVIGYQTCPCFAPRDGSYAEIS